MDTVQDGPLKLNEDNTWIAVMLYIYILENCVKGPQNCINTDVNNIAEFCRQLYVTLALKHRLEKG